MEVGIQLVEHDQETLIFAVLTGTQTNDKIVDDSFDADISLEIDCESVC